jgi:aryl-alcohol dehydrogenase-like predicted oxidoreductase
MLSHKIVIGSAQFGLDYGIANINGKVSFDEVKKIITYAQLYQVSTIDTAISYGDSEVSMGKIGVNEWKIVTKLPKIPETCESVDSWISDNIQKSLSRLNVTKIEAILLHNPMQLLGKNGVEIWSSLRHHQSLGIVNKVGFSIYDPIELDKLYFQFKPDVVQFPYNVLDRRIETSKWLRRLRNDKVETHARSVFLQGLLLMNKNNRPKKFSQWEDIWLLWDNFLSKKNITAMHACIGFVLLNKNIDKIVVGVDSKNQLQEILDFDNNIICLDDFVRLTSNDVDLINPSRWGEG